MNFNSWRLADAHRLAWIFVLAIAASGCAARVRQPVDGSTPVLNKAVFNGVWFCSKRDEKGETTVILVTNSHDPSQGAFQIGLLLSSGEYYAGHALIRQTAAGIIASIKLEASVQLGKAKELTDSTFSDYFFVRVALTSSQLLVYPADSKLLAKLIKTKILSGTVEGDDEPIVDRLGPTEFHTLQGLNAQPPSLFQQKPFVCKQGPGL